MSSSGNNCETCIYCVYDEEYDEDFCQINMDEDELNRFLTDTHSSCPYYRLGDDYTIVRKQL